MQELKEKRDIIHRSTNFSRMAEIDAEIAMEEEVLKKLKNEMKKESASNQEV